MSEKVWVPGGEFSMGSAHHYAEEAPVRSATVEGFWMDRTPVTNEEFAAFVAETDYVTFTEFPANSEDYPGADPAALAPSSLVFTMPDGPVPLSNHFQWWSYVPGADWRHPTGPDSSIDELGQHPVVHLAWVDVVAYAEWAGGELPTEAEWEFAARGGLNGATFAWGEEDTQDTAPRANTWQGPFPYSNTAVDGWVRTSPVGTFEPNQYGLVDMIGNVWEWTRDWWTPVPGREPAVPQASCCAPSKPTAEQLSADPSMPEIHIPRKVIKGGSHLCTTQYCFRYRPAAKQPQAVDTGTSHVGFRLINR